jgi:VIT family
MGQPCQSWVTFAPGRLPEYQRGVHEPQPTGLVEGVSADDAMPSDAQVQAAVGGRATHPREPHTGGIAGRLNWLRAAVLGANDRIVSVAGIVIGVAGATLARGPIFTAGLAGLVAGAVSMALGEYGRSPASATANAH